MSICHEAEKFLGESQTESIVALVRGKIWIKKSTNQKREHNISFEDFLGHRRDPRVQGEIVKLQEFAPIIICVILRKNDNSGLKLKVL